MAKAELGILLQDLRGKAGNTVFQGSRDGLVVRALVKGSNPDTPAQQAVRYNLTQAGQVWKTLDSAHIQAWRNYAQTITKHNPVNGKTYHPTPFAAFVALATKFLQVNPGGTIPTTPPTTSFGGDAITFTVTPGTGKLTFTPSAPNSANATTEFLVQSLANANRKPQKKNYRSKGFHQFTTTDPFDVTVGSGSYAVEVRFVNKNTGQETAPINLDIQQVTFAVQTGGTSGAKASSKVSGKKAA